MAKKYKVNEEELSLRIEKQLERAEQFYESEIEESVLADRELYRASKEYYRKKFPKVSRISEIVTSDVANTIEWAIPGVMRVFYASDDIFTIQGVDPNDDERAKTNKALIDYQFMRETDGFLLFYDWIKLSMKERISLVKCYWDRHKATEVMEVNVSPEELKEMRDAGFDITAVEPLEDGTIKVKFNETKMLRNSPKFEVLSIADLRWNPEAMSLDSANFVAERIITNMDTLRRREQDGFYKNISKIKPGNIAFTRYEQETKKYGSSDEEEQEDALKPVLMYEIYMKTDINGDGMAEDVVVHWCNKQILKIQENTMGRHPYFPATPIREPRKIYPIKGFAELLGELQDIKTALLRQIIANVAINNDKQAFVNVDVMVDVNEFVQGKKAVRVNGDPRLAVYYMPTEPIPPQVFTLFEFLEATKETQTGVTRYNQGQDASSLNKMLALDTPIPMADGTFKNNGDIVDGDLVIGSDGQPTRVIHAHPIQIPEHAYEITFQNGDVIRSGGEHRWHVRISDKHYKNKTNWFKCSADELFMFMEDGNHVFVPRVGPVEFIEQELPLDPYIFGLWLGDGNAHTNRFTSLDPEIVASFEKWAKQFYGGRLEETKQQNSGRAKTYQLVNTPFRRMLKDLGCLKDSRYEETKNNRKHIPDIYLQGSFEQRLSLLRGLMDTDGCIDKNGNAIFCNSEPALIDGVAKLIEGLGGKPNINWRTVKMQDRDYGPHAHITFSMPYCPVSLPRKVSRWKTRESYWTEQSVVSVREIPTEPMRCLTVAAEDELYCCGRRFTVTSNTATGITQIMGAANQRLEMIVRLIAEGGVKPMLRHLIKMNQMYMEEPMVIRIANKPLQFSPDDLQGNIDVTVNSGVGTGVKQTQIQNLQLLISLYQLTIQAGASDPGHLSYAFRKLVEELGFKNVDDFSFSPDQIRQNIQAQQAAAQQEQEMMMQMKQQMMGGVGGGAGTGGPTGETPAGAIVPSGEGQIDPRILAALAGEPQE